jgi:hypothetical protein
MAVMAGIERYTDREPRDRCHITLTGAVVALHGWGQATPPKWNVRIELRDPGQLLITRGPARFPREVATIPITRLQLGVKEVNRARGGGWVGGGFGIGGALLGAAQAKVFNSVTHSEWEETRLSVTERLPTGAHRRMTVTLGGDTPASLLETLRPALNAWSQAWVDAAIHGETATLTDPTNVDATLNEIRAMRRRDMLDTGQALILGSYFARPVLDHFRERLLRDDVDHDEAGEILTALDTTAANGLLRPRDLGPIRRLLQAVPPPSIQADRGAERDRLLAQLDALRRTGAITEAELLAERARLLNT